MKEVYNLFALNEESIIITELEKHIQDINFLQNILSKEEEKFIKNTFLTILDQTKIPNTYFSFLNLDILYSLLNKKFSEELNASFPSEKIFFKYVIPVLLKINKNLKLIEINVHNNKKKYLIKEK